MTYIRAGKGSPGLGGLDGGGCSWSWPPASYLPTHPFHSVLGLPVSVDIIS